AYFIAAPQTGRRSQNPAFYPDDPQRRLSDAEARRSPGTVGQIGNLSILTMKLSTRIVALAFINLVLLAGVFLAFAHYQFHLNLNSFLVAPAEDRVRDVA